MQQITSGRVVYGRTVQPAQYESKKAEVELTFAVEEGADGAVVDAFMRDTAKKAQTLCLEMVGLKPAVTPSVVPLVVAPPAAATKEASAASMNAKETAKKPGRPKKEAPPVEPDPLDLSEAQISTGNERVDPEQADPDGLTLDAGTEQPPTDTELQEAVQKKNAAIKNPAAIKALRSKYTDGISINNIPPEKRRDFLKELAALT